MKIWVDLANSPHPLFFEPVVRRLRSDGHEVVLTARDHAQTIELARARWPEVEVIGGESPRGRASKLLTLVRRIDGLRRWAAATRPDVALSHNSYAQIVAAQARRIPAVTAMDFEHQPANHVAFRLARIVLLPEVLPIRALKHQGATAHKIIRYPGLKEELYVGDFQPDADILRRLGVQKRPQTVVVARTPPTRALYHPDGNSRFDDALAAVCRQEDLVCLVLPRHREHQAAIAAVGLPNCVVLPRAVDSRSLLYASDMLIGGGGTMTREAALMGIPTWSLYSGAPSAVDLWLEREGLLSRVNDVEQLMPCAPRPRPPRDQSELRERGRAIEQVVVDATLAVCRTRADPRRPRGTAER